MSVKGHAKHALTAERKRVDCALAIWQARAAILYGISSREHQRELAAKLAWIVEQLTPVGGQPPRLRFTQPASAPAASRVNGGRD